MKTYLHPVMMSGMALILLACSAENTDYAADQTSETSEIAVADVQESGSDTIAEALPDAVADLDPSAVELSGADEATEAELLAETSIEDTAAVSDDEPAEISTIAALIYADWCPSCKVLDPAVKAARDTHEFEGVKFVTLDYTQRDDIALFASADAAGIGMGVRDRFAGGVKTGLLLVFDASTGEILQELTKADTPEAIANKLMEL